jgi:hypothetical protein
MLNQIVNEVKTEIEQWPNWKRNFIIIILLYLLTRDATRGHAGLRGDVRGKEN